jgi:type IV pilus assembly protein PilC
VRTARFVDSTLLRVPVVGEMLRKIALARFMHSFATLYESNIGIVGGLRNARATLGNHALEALLEDAEKQILSGQPLSSALEGILPVFALRVIRIGERSGGLGKSLHDIAHMQYREVNAMTQRLIGGLEPALTLVIGGLLAWIVLAVLGPIYGSLGKLTGMN